MDQQNYPHRNYKAFIIVLAILAIAIWLVSVYLYRLKKEREEMAVVPAPAPIEITPSSAPQLALSNTSVKLVAAKSQTAVGAPIILTLKVDSDGRDIVGYDTLIGYSADALTFVSSTSVLPTYTIFSSAKNGLVSLTGSKNLTVKTPTVFTSSDVARITFTPKKAGTYQIATVLSSGKQKSQLIDAKLNKLYPHTSSVTIVVK